MKVIEAVFAFSLTLIIPSSVAWADSCPLARELAAKGLETFKTDKNKGLNGLISAHKSCPDDPAIAYNLGLAYYQYKRPDLAYATWGELAKKQVQDLKLMTNLGWLALELDKPDEGSAWAEKGMKLRGEDPQALALQGEILFRGGKYLDALGFASKHPKGLPADYAAKASEYVTEVQWNVFRGGQKERAAQEMLKLAGQYLQFPRLTEAKDKMVTALLDANADIPLPRPLPDRPGGGGGGGPPPESEVLNLSSVKGVLKPQDKAYAVIVGIRNYKALSGPRFAEHDARQVQRMLTNLAGFRNDQGHIRLRLDQEATVGNLYGDLKWLMDKAKLEPESKVVFYFSGHGSPVLADDRVSIQDGLLVPYEASLDNLTERTAIPLS